MLRQNSAKDLKKPRREGLGKTIATKLDILGMKSYMGLPAE